MHARRPGFSLVELATVVAIMAILAAIAMPRFRNHVLPSNQRCTIDDLRIDGTLVPMLDILEVLSADPPSGQSTSTAGAPTP